MIEPAAILQLHHSWREAAEAGGDTAHSAAFHAFTRLKPAVEALVSNLTDLDYPHVPGVISPEPGLDARIERLETALGGPVPPVLSLFWHEVGGVSLVDRESHEHHRFFEAHGVRGWDGCTEAVLVESCEPSWLDYALYEYEAAQEADSRLEPFPLPLSPDGFFKDGFSGGDWYGVAVGDGWLATWQNFPWPAWPHRPASAPPWPCDLLGYLRTAILECAGFPGLFGVSGFEPFRRRLLSGVEPF